MGKGGKDKSCRNQVGMDAGAAAGADAGAGASSPAHRNKLTRLADGSFSIQLAQAQVVCEAQLDLPTQEIEPGISAEGDLFERMPLVAMQLRSGHMIDAQGSRPLMPGLYVLTGSSFERAESHEKLEVPDALDQHSRPVAAASPQPEPEPAWDGPPLALSQLPAHQAQALTRLSQLAQSAYEQEGSMEALYEWDIATPAGPFDDRSPAQRERDEATVRQALAELREQGLVKNPDPAVDCEWDMTPRGWASLNAG